MVDRDRIERLVREADPDALRQLVTELRRAGDEALLREVLSTRARPLRSWLDAPRSPDHRIVFALGDALLAALEARHARGLLQIRWSPDAIFVLEPPLSAAPWGMSSYEVIDLGPALDHWDPAWLDWSRPDLNAGECARYLSPEQITGARPLGVEHDLYVVGLLICDLYAGVFPWEAPGMSPAALLRESQRAGTLEFPRPLAAFPHDGLESWLQFLLKRMHRASTATRLRESLASVSRMAAGGAMPGSPFMPHGDMPPPVAKYGAPPLLLRPLLWLFGGR